MRFSTIFTVLAAGSVAFAAAVPQIVAKRDAMDVPNSFNNLGNQLGPITSQINGCKEDECTKNIVQSMIPAIEKQTSNLSGDSCGSDNTAVVSSVTNVLSTIVTSLESHKNECDGSGCPNINQDYSGLDDSLSQLLKKAFDSCPGALPSIPTALANLAPKMKNLGLTSVLSVCNLA